MDMVSEEALLERAKAGDNQAFEDVLAPHLPMLLAYSRAICGDHHSAEDVVQETALIASRNLHNLFKEADFAGWLKAIARRQSLSARRKNLRLRPQLEAVIEQAYEDPSPESTSPRRSALSECLKTLRERTGRIVRAHYFDGLSVKDMAEAFNLNSNTVKTILARARAALEECTQRQMRTDDSAGVETTP